MQVLDGLVIWTMEEKLMWETMLGRAFKDDTSVEVETLRTLGELRVQELTDQGRPQFAQSAAKHVNALPKRLH